MYIYIYIYIVNKQVMFHLLNFTQIKITTCQMKRKKASNILFPPVVLCLKNMRCF